jgi:hypothetical protein
MRLEQIEVPEMSGKFVPIHQSSSVEKSLCDLRRMLCFDIETHAVNIETAREKDAKASKSRIGRLLIRLNGTEERRFRVCGDAEVTRRKEVISAIDSGDVNVPVDFLKEEMRKLVYEINNGCFIRDALNKSGRIGRVESYLGLLNKINPEMAKKIQNELETVLIDSAMRFQNPI